MVRVRFASRDHVRFGQPLVELDAWRDRLAVDLAKAAVAEPRSCWRAVAALRIRAPLFASHIEADVTSLQSAEIEPEQA